MKSLRIVPFALSVVLAALTGCGATVGDACTVDADCGGQSICINNADYTPGGYCTKPCSPLNDSTCPSGSTCVSQMAADDVSACMRECTSSDDCRSGYLCLSGIRGNAHSICVGSEVD